MKTLSHLSPRTSFVKLSFLDDVKWLGNRNRKFNKVQCHGGNFSIENSTNGGGVASSVFKELVTLSNKEHHSAALVVEHKSTGGLVLSPNGGNGNVIDLAPCLVHEDDQNGIGIVKFLSGKNFFVTGATGFLAKGKFS